MAAIGDIVSKASGTAGAWAVKRSPMHCAGTTRTVEVATLYHYGTAMLSWEVKNPGNRSALYMGTGWWSVSDQNGMNIAFRILSLPYSYKRAGGAGIVRNDAAASCGYSRSTSKGGEYRRITYDYRPA